MAGASESEIFQALRPLVFGARLCGVFPANDGAQRAYTLALHGLLFMACLLGAHNELVNTAAALQIDKNYRSITMAYTGLLFHIALVIYSPALLLFVFRGAHRFQALILLVDDEARRLGCLTSLCQQLRARAWLLNSACYFVLIFMFVLEMHVFKVAELRVVLATLLPGVYFLASMALVGSLLGVFTEAQRTLYLTISTEIQTMSREPSSISAKRLMMLRTSHATLAKITNAVSSIFGPALLVTLPLAFYLLVLCLYFVVISGFGLTESNRWADASDVVYESGTWSLLLYGFFVLLATLCQAATDQGNRASQVLQKLEYVITEECIREEVWLFRAQLPHFSSARYSVFGIFWLDRGLLRDVHGAVVTYLVTLMQFHLLTSSPT